MSMAGRQRAAVLGAVFACLLVASVMTIMKRGGVDAAAWTLLLFSGVLAAAALMAFFSKDEEMDTSQATNLDASTHSDSTVEQSASEGLPDPAEAGFDVPVL